MLNKSFRRVANLTTDKQSGDKASNVTTHKEWLTAAFEKHRSELHYFILRKMGSVEEAEELTQDVYVRLIRYDHPANIDNLQAFLFTTASNIIRDRIRRLYARHHTMHEPLENIEIESDDDIERQLENKEQMRILMDAIGELEADCRQALMLHRFENWTHARIAQELGTTVGVVRRYISVALVHCQNRLMTARKL